jgi:hypothetical protein
MTRGGKRLDVDDLSDPDVETSEVVEDLSRPRTHKIVGVTLRPLCPDSDQVRATTQYVAMGQKIIPSYAIIEQKHQLCVV